jgi:putative SOS response-associated peptidase YedK
LLPRRFVITAPAIEHIAHIHGRLAVFLEESAYDAWLSCEAQGDEAKALMLDNDLDRQLEFFRVGREAIKTPYEATETRKLLINSLR